MPRKKPEQAKTSEQDTWKEDASKLSYEEALQALDVLLGQLQDDSCSLSGSTEKSCSCLDLPRSL
jgi:exodeoxyribonuclease VII small subunit